MCGILGQINFKNKEIDNNNFKLALDMQIHRGPNDSDIYIDKNFIFGHRRLSIIDLHANAKQPMVSDCQNFILVFNGEIYNYQELKKTLIKKGYKFNTNSDTEVLLNSFIEYGINCIKKFIGMFAFTIYDKKKNEFFIVRDRLGIKPLYYYQDNEKFIFSSEIKSILALDIKKQFNKEAISSYISFRYPILNDTFFKNIYSLSPAHYIHIKNNKIKFNEYWNVTDKFKEQLIDKGEEYYIDKLKDLLESSVKYRMISDVPIGSFLSGGVDSSIITAIMVTNSKDKIKTFTIGFKEKGFNEFEYANIIAKKYNTNHTEIILSGTNYIKTMENLIAYKDAPLSVPNEVPLYLMSKELKKYITVVLSGEGADEIFGGYGRIFRSPYDYERIKNIDNLDLSEKEKEQLSKNFIQKYGVKSFRSEIEHFSNIYSYTPFSMKSRLLHKSLNLKETENKLKNKFLEYFDELENESYYNKIMYVFEKIHLVGLLHRVDMTTMATSVEARVPFIDHRLVEFAFTIPIKYKLKWIDKHKSKTLMSDKISENNDIPKYILKKAYEDIIPKKVLYRKKMGFPVPLNEWFGGDFNVYAKNILLSDKAKNRNIFNISEIKQILNNNLLQNNHSLAMKIWMLINIELFCKHYFDKGEI
jgi:asparagine synthase (glutamine-hydrolysing)